jgi:hypothetical protein
MSGHVIEPFHLIAEWEALGIELSAAAMNLDGQWWSVLSGSLFFVFTRCH